VIGLARSSLQYRPDPKDDNALRLALIRLAKQYGRYGYRKIAGLLLIEGWKVNHKKEQNGRERCLHDRFVIRKRVEVPTATKVYDGVLRDISVGGAAIQVRGPLYEADIITVNLNDLGEFDGQALLSLDEDMVLVEFEVAEQQTINLAAKPVGIYCGAEAEKPKDPNEIDELRHHGEMYEEGRLAFDALMHWIERGYADLSE